MSRSPRLASIALLLAACSQSTPSNTSLAYVGNNDATASSVSVFRVDAATGMLTLARTIATAPGGATYCEMHPSARFLFVTGQFGATLSSYALDSSGMFSVAASTVPTGANPHNLAVHPDGRFVYVANTSSNSVSGFVVGSDGKLTEMTGSPFAAGATPYDVKVSDSGKFAYAVNRDTDDVSLYAVDADTGALSPLANPRVGVGCRTPPCGPRAIELSPDGLAAFVPNRFSNDVSVFRVDPASGNLTAVPGSPFPAGTDPRSAAVDPSGRHLYVPNTVSNDVTAFAIDPTTLALTPLAGSPYPAGSVPLSIEADESGRYLYVANSASNDVSIFAIETQKGTLSPVATVLTAGSAFSIALK
jgi:YVTN family beta-propeller protein